MRKSKLLLIALALIIAAALFMPWKHLIEDRLRSTLAAQGLTDIQFTLGSITMKGLEVKDLSFGPNVPLTIDTLTVDYTLSELLHRQLNQLHAGYLKIVQGATEVELKDVEVRFLPPEQKRSWRGEWTVGEATLPKSDLKLPPLAGSGTWNAASDHISGEGEFKSSDNSHRARFNVKYLPQNKEQSRVTVNSAQMPWHGGVISTEGAQIRLDGKPSTVTMRVNKVPLDALLSLATKGRATATGVVSGTIPVVIGSDGELTFKAGKLAAEAPGTIALAANAIPGDNAQLGVLTTVLSDFHYSDLAMSMDSNKDGKLELLLSVAGNNPNAYEGRAVKLNMHLTGDVLDFLRQSVIPIADPQQFLKQDSHDKP